MFFVSFLCFVCNVFICNSLHFNLSIRGESVHGYYTPLPVGSPPQILNFLIDTGSSNTAVACTNPLGDNSIFFHYDLSNTFKSLNDSISLKYVVGQWSGFLSQDIIHIGNFSSTLTIACMLSIKEIFDFNSKFQGLLGLAYPEIAFPNKTVTPFLNTLLTNDEAMMDTFTVELCGPYFTSKIRETVCGQIVIGQIPPMLENANTHYTPIVKEWYYEVIMTDIKLNNISAPFKCWELNQEQTTIDTGTTDLYLPKDVYEWILYEMKKHVLLNIPKSFWANKTIICAPDQKFNITNFPAITLSLYKDDNSSFDLLVSPEQYLVSIKNLPSSMLCIKLALSMAEHSTVIGSSILKGYNVVFDRQNKRIGFANSTHFLNNSIFPGFVKEANASNILVKLCKKESVTSQGIRPFLIVLLCFSVAISLMILYMIVSWILKCFNIKNDDSSDTSSLVDGMVMETWNEQEDFSRLREEP